ncbi:hypothetical protein HPB48_004232 [Haemaphysalis longicornis]|uniref:Mediator of RNA polymerase II transcription subunit 29 n=1 Tax=Haemaphysalis longicornis TaxID=44386 RepID=A0A9J6GNQ2_HAELO|nr:hypothetical protein HPB48_004232 [Haemaphysalis longicornis]
MPQHPGQAQAAHPSQGQTSTTEVKFDNVAKVKALVWSLKDALSRTIQECALQLRDSHQYLPVPVVATKPDPSNPQDGTLSYSQYINTIRAQVSFAKAVQDVLNEGARRINQPE